MLNVNFCSDPPLTPPRDVGERTALADVRDGDVNRGLDWYETNDRVVAMKDSGSARVARQADRTFWVGSRQLDAIPFN